MGVAFLAIFGLTLPILVDRNTGSLAGDQRTANYLVWTRFSDLGNVIQWDVVVLGVASKINYLRFLQVLLSQNVIGPIRPFWASEFSKGCFVIFDLVMTSPRLRNPLPHPLSAHLRQNMHLRQKSSSK
ncbi:MAG: hypothetical protein LQ338_004913 [Usnochroma carphineum]|nr:MAG: hypothetical protein LQ338_004913 [Usnochroma carphineum]